MKKYKDANGEPCKYRYYVFAPYDIRYRCVGGSDSLRGARIIAGKNQAWSVNGQTRAQIYPAESTELPYKHRIDAKAVGSERFDEYRMVSLIAGLPLPDFA